MDLSAWINPAYLEDTWLTAANARYGAETPFPHGNIRDFLLPERFAALSDALSAEEFTHKESDLFSLAQTTDLSGATEGPLGAFVAMLNSPEFRDWIERLTGVSAQKRLDLFGAIYQDADYLLPHDDQLEDRRIAFILYLTTLSADEGGALAIYDDKDGHPGSVVERYPATENTLNLFTVSEASWHEVEEVTSETYRVSLGGWLRG